MNEEYRKKPRQRWQDRLPKTPKPLLGDYEPIVISNLAERYGVTIEELEKNSKLAGIFKGKIDAECYIESLKKELAAKKGATEQKLDTLITLINGLIKILANQAKRTAQ
jgi:hypothetical protein